MIAVALLVLVLAVMLTVSLIIGGDESLTVDMFGSDVTTSGVGLYLAGIITCLASLFALWLLRVGLRRTRRAHKQLHDLQRRSEELDKSRDDEDRPADWERSPSGDRPTGGDEPPRDTD